ncbi:MAG: TatD family hydrolase [Bdellovibrionota bacterium]
MMFIDSHCHLHYDYDGKNIPTMVHEAGLANVSIMINVATDTSLISTLEETSMNYPVIYHTAGVHPHEASSFKDSDLAIIEKAAGNIKCVAIGEIGLDYHYEHSTRQQQKKVLEQQLELAATLGKPAVIHSREAEPDLLSILKKHALSAKSAPGVLHCYTGTMEFAMECLGMGFFISFSGIITFKNAEKIREVAKITPDDRLLIETDAPYLAPVPFRGKKCEPSMLPSTAQKISEIRSTPIEHVAAITTANAKKLFRLPA